MSLASAVIGTLSISTPLYIFTYEIRPVIFKSMCFLFLPYTAEKESFPCFD